MMTPLHFDHLSIPTNEHRAGEVRDRELGGFIGGDLGSPYRVRWCRYADDSPLPKIIRSIPHVAFVVADLEKWLAEFPILVEPLARDDGVRSAFVADNGIPIRLMESRDAEFRDTLVNGEPGALRYNSCWMPTSIPRGDGKEVHLADLKMYVVPHFDSPFRVGWVRYQVDAPYPVIVSRIPHLAFEVDDMAIATRGRRLIIQPNSPTPGLVVAFIEDDGAPIEFLQVDRRILPNGV